MITASMKFDVVVGNPPFNGKAALHQQFFNKSYDLLVGGGTLAIIQPATTYFNKKANQKDAVVRMQDIIKSNPCKVVINNSEVFEHVSIQSNLSTTMIIKTKKLNNTIDQITYQNGNTYYNVRLEDIIMTQIDPVVFAIIRNKYEKYVLAHGSLENKVTKNPEQLKAHLGRLRGTRPTASDYYTFIPLRKNREQYVLSMESTFGIIASSETEADYIYDYMESYVARFGLSLLKFAQTTANKEFALVPLVEFNKHHNDKDLCRLLKLTPKELLIIKQVMAPLYEGR